MCDVVDVFSNIIVYVFKGLDKQGLASELIAMLEPLGHDAALKALHPNGYDGSPGHMQTISYKKQILLLIAAHSGGSLVSCVVNSICVCQL